MSFSPSPSSSGRSRASASATRSPPPRGRASGWAGFVPFGYRAKDRTLVIDEDEAERVRLIYPPLSRARHGLGARSRASHHKCVTRAFISASNKSWGDRRSAAGISTRSSPNPIYAGKIGHKGQATMRASTRPSSRLSCGNRCSGRLPKNAISGETAEAREITHATRDIRDQYD